MIKTVPSNAGRAGLIPPLMGKSTILWREMAWFLMQSLNILGGYSREIYLTFVNPSSLIS